MNLATEIPWERLSGLRPKAALIIGPGLIREEIKKIALTHTGGFTAGAVMNLQDLCMEVLESNGTTVSRERILGSATRQEFLREWLRVLLRRPGMGDRFPELKRLRRRMGFIEKLDRSVQSARLIAAHAEEREVMTQRLRDRFGPNPLRDELLVVAAAYENWLKERNEWDAPRIYAEALDLNVSLGKEFYFLKGQPSDGLEQLLLDKFKRELNWKEIEVWDQSTGEEKWSWDRWHTLDDAVDAAAEEIARSGEFEHHTVVIPDDPSVRRSVYRAFDRRKIPIADPRDPQEVQKSEFLKQSLLPLEVVSGRFDRIAVEEWLQVFESREREAPRWIREMRERGIRLGLSNYQSGNLVLLHRRLQELEQSFSGRLLLRELRVRHLAYLSAHADERWVQALDWLEGIYQDFDDDLRRFEMSPRAPLSLWLTRLRERIEQIKPMEARLRPDRGVALYRLGTVALTGTKGRKIWTLGLPPNWIQTEKKSDYWLSEREGDFLSLEFALHSSAQWIEFRKRSLIHAISGAAEVHVLDATYSWDGSERESVGAMLREIPGFALEKPTERGAHAKWLPSFGMKAAPASLDVKLSPWSRVRDPGVDASALDHYSRCAFMGLAKSRWKLYDTREPDADPWGDAKGDILHKAVELLLRSGLTLSPDDALEQAWSLKGPRGLLRSARLIDHAKNRMRRVLQNFVVKEREYQEQSGAKVWKIEEQELLSLELPEGKIRGRPDRIDEHQEGIVIMDYKSSSSVPGGQEMLEQGYRLQLPFYALAARKAFGREVHGAQFIQLIDKAQRNQGIFPKKFVGKDPGSLIHLTARSKSLIPLEPEEIWSRMDGVLRAEFSGLASGHYSARPKLGPQECRSCTYGYLCGIKRVRALMDEET